MKICNERYGKLQSVSITKEGVLLVCKEGIGYINVPRGVIEALRARKAPLALMRFTDSGTFIAADKKSFTIIDI